MGNNIFQGQLKGPFNANTDLYSLIRLDAGIDLGAIIHFGIETKKDTFININGNPTQVGHTGIYEIGNTRIVGLMNPEYMNANTIIDYTITQIGGNVPQGTGSGSIPDGGEQGAATLATIRIVEDEEDRKSNPVPGDYYYQQDEGELWYFTPEKMWDLVISGDGTIFWETDW